MPACQISKEKAFSASTAILFFPGMIAFIYGTIRIFMASPEDLCQQATEGCPDTGLCTTLTDPKTSHGITSTTADCAFPAISAIYDYQNFQIMLWTGLATAMFEALLNSLSTQLTRRLSPCTLAILSVVPAIGGFIYANFIGFIHIVLGLNQTCSIALSENYCDQYSICDALAGPSGTSDDQYSAAISNTTGTCAQAAIDSAMETHLQDYLTAIIMVGGILMGVQFCILSAISHSQGQASPSTPATEYNTTTTTTNGGHYGALQDLGNNHLAPTGMGG